jgi:hypothetical protein
VITFFCQFVQNCLLLNMVCSFVLDFSWDKNCAVSKDSSSVFFYPNYEEIRCDSKAAEKFDSWDSVKYVSKAECCKERFSDNIRSCCEEGNGGECSLSGNTLYLPDWVNQTCIVEDENLLADHQIGWATKSMQQCCKTCKCHQCVVGMICSILGSS